MIEAIIAVMFLVLGYIIGKHLGMKKGWAYCETYMLQKIGEEMDKCNVFKQGDK